MDKGFTLTEMAITMATIIIVSTVIVGFSEGCEADWKKAEESAVEFSKNVSGATGKVSCMKTDSDNDGYCRCTVFRENKDPLHVECGCEKFCLICTRGCAGIKPNIRTR